MKMQDCSSIKGGAEDLEKPLAVGEVNSAGCWPCPPKSVVLWKVTPEQKIFLGDLEKSPSSPLIFTLV